MRMLANRALIEFVKQCEDGPWLKNSTSSRSIKERLALVQKYASETTDEKILEDFSLIFAGGCNYFKREATSRLAPRPSFEIKAGENGKDYVAVKT